MLSFICFFSNNWETKKQRSQALSCTPIIPALRKCRQRESGVRSQSRLHKKARFKQNTKVGIRCRHSYAWILCINPSFPFITLRPKPKLTPKEGLQNPSWAGSCPLPSLLCHIFSDLPIATSVSFLFLLCLCPSEAFPSSRRCHCSHLRELLLQAVP